MDLVKARPPFLLAAPAVQHEVVQFARGAGGRGEVGPGGVATVQLVTEQDQLVVSEGVVGVTPSEGEDLPEGHGERPDVGFCRKPTLRQPSQTRPTAKLPIKEYCVT